MCETVYRFSAFKNPVTELNAYKLCRNTYIPFVIYCSSKYFLFIYIFIAICLIGESMRKRIS